MKKNNLFKVLLLSAVVIISSCTSDSDNNDPVVCSLSSSPTEYSFADNGNSTVYYGGQASRLGAAEDVYNTLNADAAYTQAQLITDFAINNIAGKFAENVGNGTYGSNGDRAKIVADLHQLFADYEGASADFEAGTVAAPGQAGLLVKSSTSSSIYELTADGWEVDQQYAKMLIGALCLEQNAYDYLTKIDLTNDNTTRGYDGDQAWGSTYYTKAEHYFDEAYGYVYGLDHHTNGNGYNFAGDLTDEINNDLFLGKYLSKHDGNGASGNNWRGDAYNAYVLGRQAIVDNCQDVLDAQINIINTTLSKVVAWHAADYLTKASLDALSSNDYSGFNHGLSEAWGFVYSLQFTKMSNGMPLFSHDEVNAMITEMNTTTAWGFKNTDGAARLQEMADQINTRLAAY
tara:strand:+ start:198 stop:1403 length:1206 start_codon:yes stop_codon:yes gene_type:complete